MSHWPQSHTVPYTTSSSHGFTRRGVHHCCPVKFVSFSFFFFFSWARRAREKSRIRGMPASRSRGSSALLCVCGGAEDYLSPFTAATWAERAGPRENWRQIEPTGACGDFSALYHPILFFFFSPSSSYTAIIYPDLQPSRYKKITKKINR